MTKYNNSTEWKKLEKFNISPTVYFVPRISINKLFETAIIIDR